MVAFDLICLSPDTRGLADTAADTGDMGLVALGR